jgi:DNA-binding NarL/FixJ family response regulator
MNELDFDTISRIRVFLVDDHPIVCSGLKVLLERENDMEVVGEADDGLSAQEGVAQAQPHVVVMDLGLPRLGGLAATKSIKASFPAIHVLALSALDERTQLPLAMSAGASGFLPKRAAAAELVRAIRLVARGGVYVTPSDDTTNFSSPARPGLSERESEVLRLLAAGHSARDIAAKLAISARTLETYRARALEKLGLKTRVDIVQYAVQCGWLSATSPSE